MGTSAYICISVASFYDTDRTRGTTPGNEKSDLEKLFDEVASTTKELARKLNLKTKSFITYYGPLIVLVDMDDAFDELILSISEKFTQVNVTLERFDLEANEGIYYPEEMDYPEIRIKSFWDMMGS